VLGSRVLGWMWRFQDRYRRGSILVWLRGSVVGAGSEPLTLPGLEAGRPREPRNEADAADRDERGGQFPGQRESRIALGASIFSMWVPTIFSIRIDSNIRLLRSWLRYCRRPLRRSLEAWNCFGLGFNRTTVPGPQ